MTPLKLFLVMLVTVIVLHIFEMSAKKLKYTSFVETLKFIAGIIIVAMFCVIVWGIIYYVNI